MSENKKGEETFLATVHKGWRITIYEPIRESLGLEIDDRLKVTVLKDGAGSRDFLAKVHKGWRVTIYEPIRESLGLEIDDRLRVTIRKDEEARENVST